MKLRYIAIFIGAALGVALVTIFFGDNRIQSSNEQENPNVTPTGTAHSIVLTLDGYQPRDVAIRLGDALTFSVSPDYEEMHWPASNIHPTHGVYPEFDPLRPVPRNETWSFIFTQAGEWKFHDHLAPRHTGSVTVIE